MKGKLLLLAGAKLATICHGRADRTKEEGKVSFLSASVFVEANGVLNRQAH